MTGIMRRMTLSAGLRFLICLIICLQIHAQQSNKTGSQGSIRKPLEISIIGMRSKEGKEACNCGSTDDVDHHLWLADEPSVDRSEAMVVEISPRLLPTHPKWNVQNLSQVIKNKQKVRISGWMM